LQKTLGMKPRGPQKPDQTNHHHPPVA
jgi:hypothetical protein